MENLPFEKLIMEWKPPPDRYANYLTAEDLCHQSGLSPEELIRF
jgi:hypothetical protein